MARGIDTRETRFLASQAERLSDNKKQPGGIGDDGDGTPELVHGETDPNDNASGFGSKEQSHLFWKRFRKICSEFQTQIDLLLLTPSGSTTDISSNMEGAKTYYATAARRNEGRLKLDRTLAALRSLQRHALSSSSASISMSNNEKHEMDLLHSILQNPMTGVTQTDVRLISQEIDTILKRIDRAREIICPKEKFVFTRYRKAMEEKQMLGDGDIRSSTVSEKSNGTKEKLDAKDERDTENQQTSLRSKYGGVLENRSNCTIEISSDGTIRSVDALRPASHANRDQAKPLNTDESSSYLVQNLHNVTLLIQGSRRPSLHLQNIHNCRIYVSEPTFGPVHVTNCRSSKIRCSCYQLRLHDSKDVKFNVWVRSGPIIEDCTAIVFEGNYYCVGGKDGVNNAVSSGVGAVGRNMFWDVKDFNWLRALRKSPNFMVITQSSGKKEMGGGEIGSPTNDGDCVSNSPVPKTLPDGENDSEDEL